MAEAQENDEKGQQGSKDGERIDTLPGQECPVCREKACTLTEMERRIPWGDDNILIYIFSMSCSNCKYHKADVEFAEEREPSKYSVEVSGEADMKIRIIRSGEGTVKIPHITTIEGGPTSNGYITNVEGLLNRVKHAIEIARDSAEDDEDRKKAKNLLKKLTRIMWGQESCKIIIEDKTGNSAIISEKAVKAKL